MSPRRMPTQARLRTAPEASTMPYRSSYRKEAEAIGRPAQIGERGKRAYDEPSVGHLAHPNAKRYPLVSLLLLSDEMFLFQKFESSRKW